MKKSFLFLFVFFSFSKLYSQVIIVKEGENSARTEKRFENADAFAKSAQEAVDKGDIEKANYYLDLWSKNKALDQRYYIVDAEVRTIQAKTFLASGHKPSAKALIKRARRSYMKAFDLGCYECKEKADELKKILE